MLYYKQLKSKLFVRLVNVITAPHDKWNLTITKHIKKQNYGIKKGGI